MASKVSGAGSAGAIGEFGRWWARELRGLVPGGLRRLVGLERDVLLIQVDDDAAWLYRLAGGRLGELGPLPEGRRWRPERNTRIVLRLAPAMGLQKTVSLPLAAEEDLAQVLEFEMERQTPFRAEQVFFYHEVVERQAAERRLKVRLAVVPRPAVEAALARVSAASLVPEIVDLGDPDAPVDARHNLLPADRRPSRRRRGLATLVVLTVLLLAAAALSPVWRYGQAVAAMDAEIEALRPAAQRALELRNRLDEQLGGAAAVAAIKARTPVAVLLLEETTRLLPDDTWLAQWNLVDGRLEVEGVSASAAALIPLVEGSPRFSRVSIRTPIVRDPGTGLERFQFLIELEAPKP